MLDIFWSLPILFFFLLAWVFTRACDRLMTLEGNVWITHSRGLSRSVSPFICFTPFFDRRSSKRRKLLCGSSECRLAGCACTQMHVAFAVCPIFRIR